MESYFGNTLRRAADARLWAHPLLLDPNIAGQIREEYARGGALPHVCLRDAIQPDVAQAIQQGLRQARFVPHAHPGYTLHVARRPEQGPSALTDFMDWLGSENAADYHLWLCGEPRPQGPLRVQVQTSRMLGGEAFPDHVDTHAAGIAVVYNFTERWAEGDGGELVFPRPDGAGARLRIPPLFNQVLIFRSRDVPHHVTRVRNGAAPRYSVTAFYLDPREDSEAAAGPDNAP